MAQKIGKIDLYVTTLLHPSMRDYSTENRAFKIQRKEKDVQTIKKENEKRLAEKKELEKKLEAMKKEVEKEDERYGLEMGDLNYVYIDNKEEKATGTVELNKILHKRKMDEASVYHMSRLKGIYNECVKLQKKIDSLAEEPTDYTNKEETDKKILEIIEDVKKHTKTIASQKGITIVLNSSYRNLLPKNIDYNDNSTGDDAFSFGSIFTDPYPRDHADDAAGVTGYYLNVESKTENWLSLGNAIFGDLANRIVSEDIIFGGTDLTSDVLSSIYKEHKIDPNLSVAILKCVKNK